MKKGSQREGSGDLTCTLRDGSSMPPSLTVNLAAREPAVPLVSSFEGAAEAEVWLEWAEGAREERHERVQPVGSIAVQSDGKKRGESCQGRQRREKAVFLKLEKFQHVRLLMEMIQYRAKESHSQKDSPHFASTPVIQGMHRKYVDGNGCFGRKRCSGRRME